jgi:hypothetical protein
MIGFELLSSHRSVEHRIELDGYEDFEHQGYWTHPHFCRPQLLTIGWTKRNDGPWTPELTLWVTWVRKDGTVSPEKHVRKDISVTLPGNQRWGAKMLALPWMIPLLEKFDQDFVPGEDS